MRGIGFYTAIAAIILLAIPVNAKLTAHDDVALTPPAPIYEVTPGERSGYVWTPGFWRWDGKRYVWNGGHWIAQREGNAWIPDSWDKHGDKWHYTAGHWEGENVVVTAEEEEITPSLASVVPSSNASAVSSNKKPKHAMHKHVLKKPDYSNTRLWPRVQQH